MVLPPNPHKNRLTDCVMYNFLWKPPINLKTAPGLDNVSAGTYTVTVTDQDTGCEVSVNYTISDIGAPTLNVNSVTDASCGLANGSTNADDLGTDYDYGCTDVNGDAVGTNSFDLNNVLAGDYTLTATNVNNGCIASTS